MQRSGAVGSNKQVHRCAAGCVVCDFAVLRSAFRNSSIIAATFPAADWLACGWVLRDEVRETAHTSSCSRTAHRTRKWSFRSRGSRHELAISARVACGGDCVRCRSTSTSSGPLSSMAGCWLAGGCHRGGEGPLAAVSVTSGSSNAAACQFMHCPGLWCGQSLLRLGLVERPIASKFKSRRPSEQQQRRLGSSAIAGQGKASRSGLEARRSGVPR